MPVEVIVSEGGSQENIIIEAGNNNTLAVQSTRPAALSLLNASNTVENSDRISKNAVSNQQSIDQLSLSILGKALNLITDLGPKEAKAAQVTLTGSTLAEDIASLKATTADANSNSGGVTPLTPIYPPIHHVVPDPIPGGQTVYANMPLYLVYDNPNGTDNLTYTVVPFVPPLD